MIKIPGILKSVFPDITWKIKEDTPAIYLTFDDGPTPEITGEVLSMLKHFKAAATFFCIGRNVERHPDIYEKILEGGHAVGNHTYSHLKGWYTADTDYYEDITLAAQFIHSSLYRPAYGMIRVRQKNHLQHYYRIVMWDVMSYDFNKNKSPQTCLNNVIQNAGTGSVVVFHDSVKASKNLLYTLPRVLEYYAEKGWAFKSIPQMNSSVL